VYGRIERLKAHVDRVQLVKCEVLIRLLIFVLGRKRVKGRLPKPIPTKRPER